MITSGLVVMVWTASVLYGLFRPLPEGVSVRGSVHPGSQVDFLHDLTFLRGSGPVVEQSIFQKVFGFIDEADEFIVMDMFLLNDEHAGDREYLPISQELITRLIAKKQALPHMSITLITDEINNFYGSYLSREIRALRESGIDVVITDMTKLRDSNPLYSAPWRMVLQWFGTGGKGFLPHPLSSRGQRVTARSYLKLLNFKANHRKLVVTEDGCLVTSANPHDASSYHSNIAFAARGGVCNDILASERAVAEFSDGEIPRQPVAKPDSGELRLQYLTEGMIRRELLRTLHSAGAEDRIDIAMFYLSERRVIRALIEAARRSVGVRIILDPNKDAFGRQKGGIPNRQVAGELARKSDGRIALRWYDTHGEQFHTKLVVVTTQDSVTILGGSANLTRRNIGDYNLEADLKIVAPGASDLVAQVADYYERIWNNVDGHYTVPLDVYLSGSVFKRLVYRIQEFTGFCTY